MVLAHISWFCAPNVHHKSPQKAMAFFAFLRAKNCYFRKNFVLLSAPGFDWTRRKDFHPPCLSPYARGFHVFSGFHIFPA